MSGKRVGSMEAPMPASLQIKVQSAHFIYNKKLLRTILRQAGQEVARADRQLLGQQGSGRKYGRWTASAPGMPAAKRTGALRKSIKVRVGRNGDSVRIVESQYYSRFLE